MYFVHYLGMRHKNLIHTTVVLSVKLYVYRDFVNSIVIAKINLG